MGIYKYYKTEIILNKEQQEKFLKTVGVCRYIYNLFLDKNKELYNIGAKKKYIDDIAFMKWINNEFIPNNNEFCWIKEVSSAAIKKSVRNAHNAYQRFFKKISKFPKYKKREKNDCSMYFYRARADQIIKHERHRIKIPTLGWCKLKEYGYIPTNKQIISGTIKKKAGRFFVSVRVEEENIICRRNINEGIGLDLGVKNYVYLSNGTKYDTVNISALNKKISREQKSLLKKFKNKTDFVIGKNIDKQKIKLARLYLRRTNILTNRRNWIINQVIKQEPSFITIENLNVIGMLKNKKLSKYIQEHTFHTFIEKLKEKCYQNGIQLRQVDRFFPSSKTCCMCGKIKKELKLSDRVYNCECGNSIDRDYNASINLKNCDNYKIIV